MEIQITLFRLFKLGLGYIRYKFQQFILRTNEFVVINTHYGKVKGVKHISTYGHECSYYSFEGIPFAKPPIKQLRFREPQPAESWRNTLNCTGAKSKPKQANILVNISEGSEDCLYLNVYAKKLESNDCPNSPLPVMVWIYGGGFQCGEATRDVYAPDYWMMHDLILVTFNYRVGVLGFLSFSDPDLNIPGNAGLKDQVLALKWIKQNIHNFNGDSNNITVFGQSSGAVSLHMLMLSPLANGLFEKAILQSGSALCPWGNTDQHDWGYKLACYLGFQGRNNDKEVCNFLMQQDSKYFMDHGGSLLNQTDLSIKNLICAFVPVVEPYQTKGCFASKPYRELLADAWSNEMPIIIGGTSAEGLMYYSMTQKRPYLMEDLNKFGLVHLLPDEIKEQHSSATLQMMANYLKIMYFSNETLSEQANLLQYLDLMGHRSFWFPVYRTMRARMAYAPKVATYCYYFDFFSDNFNHGRSFVCSDPKVTGAAHGDDASYLFYNAMAEKLHPSSREFKCIKRMTGMWYNFALSSNPNCSETAPTLWHCISESHDNLRCLKISDILEFEILPVADKLKIWTKFFKNEDLI